MNREPIYAALFAKLATVPGVVTASRKLKHWADVSPIEQPALFQAQKSEVAARTTGLNPKWTLDVTLYVYVNTSGDVSPTTTLNDVLDAICAALAPLPGLTQTLAGLVHDCRIEGAIETDEGTLGDQAIALIPVRIITAA